ncbi:MAG: glutamine-hydrolyzing GMP synthase [Legionellales bacterium]|nr:glutamine-hydrolyzing GMP synthase [Legionellales bacterium]
MDQIHRYRILVLDFGGQYAQLLARRIRELGVYCVLLPYDAAPEQLMDVSPHGVILSGGPESVQQFDSPKIPDAIWRMSCPILGICYGMQAMAHALGGSVASTQVSEYGHTVIEVSPNTWLSNCVELTTSVWMSHQDQVVTCPPGFNIDANSVHCDIVAFSHSEQQYYGVQFHPEVTHTSEGFELLKYFVYECCGCESFWTPQHIADQLIEDIRATVGEDHVVLGLSGGVDSAVTAALLQRAIGHQMTAIFVDNGLLRAGEADEVEYVFVNQMGMNILRVDAQEQFLSALKGVSDPELKRKIVGREFVEVFQAQAKKLENVCWLAQGTIYPDVIESAGSASGKAHVIKSHHNVGGLPDALSLKLLEPLRELFKDEVRKLGDVLGLPGALLHRHPFPGPGLSVRVLGEVKKEYLAMVRAADTILIDELTSNNWYHRVAQALVVFLPVKTVGVVGDQRAYGYVLAIRVVETKDFMTATAAQLPEALIQKISTRIMNEVSGVTRVVYDVSSKPPATIEWE